MIARVLLIAFTLLACHAALADERILGYDIEVQVRSDGSLDVTERIMVHAEGTNIRRGIYRTFPTRYKDRFGNAVKVDLQVLSLLRNGESDTWFPEDDRNGVRSKFGNDSLAPVPADYT